MFVLLDVLRLTLPATPARVQAFGTAVKLLHGDGRLAYQVITSRVELVHLDLLPSTVPEQAVRLEPLAMDVAEKLLANKCPALSSSQARDIATICDRNALLLQLLGGFLEKKRCTPEVGPMVTRTERMSDTDPALTPCLLAQGIIDKLGIYANQGRQPKDRKVHNTVIKIGTFLSRFLVDDEGDLDWVARMSLWRSFTEQQAAPFPEQQADRIPEFLDDMVALSILQRRAARYAMHVLVREAGRKLLLERSKELQQAAQLRMLEGLVQVGAAAAPLGTVAEQRDVLAQDLDNCRLCCPIPETATRALVEGLVGLGETLVHCGFFVEAKFILEQASPLT